MSFDMILMEEKQEAKEEGAHDKAVETARSMIADNFPYDTIAKHTGLSLSEIQNLK